MFRPPLFVIFMSGNSGQLCYVKAVSSIIEGSQLLEGAGSNTHTRQAWAFLSLVRYNQQKATDIGFASIHPFLYLWRMASNWCS